jgi:FkbM family methyltransferase
MELARRGDLHPAGRCLLSAFSALREGAVSGGGLPAESRRFLGLVADRLDLSRGQCFQDVAALMFASREESGFFVEVGTGDGELHSNTFMLERTLGWRGVLFEPDRRYHETLRSTRTARLETRPAFSENDVRLRFLESSRSGALSTLEGYKGEDGRIRSGRTHEVRTVTLDRALEEAGAPRTIDFLSIDTEGSEMEVLTGIDFGRWDVRFMTVEHNYVRGKKEAVASFLAPHGFRPVLEEFSCMDVWLARPGP